MKFGRPHRHYRLTDSTNERAKELAIAGAPGGMVVTAAEQSAGRGRRGHAWFGPPGSSLLYSALLRPFGGEPLLALAVPVAVCEAVESLAALSCEVKWPNDVWVEGRKLAGVLVEARPEESWVVIGVGLNLGLAGDDFPPELRETATSVRLAAGADAVPEPIRALAALNERLTRWVEAEPGQVLAELRRRDALRGRRISWAGGEGVAEGVDDAGHLLVGTDDGERVSLGAGEVHLSVRD